MPTTPTKIRGFLSNLALFRELSAGEIERLARGTRESQVARGQILFQRGDPCEGFHAIVYGQVKLAFNSADGTEKVVEIMGPGQSFGEAVMFTEKPCPEYAPTLADSLLLHIAKATVFQEIERDPGFARRMIAGLSRRLHGLIDDLEAYTLQSGTQRVIGYLVNAVPEGAVSSPSVRKAERARACNAFQLRSHSPLRGVVFAICRTTSASRAIAASWSAA